MADSFPDGPEIELPAGDVTVGVVRIGDTVRRPHQDSSPRVAAYLADLERAGFVGAPRYLGRDQQGRDVLTYLDGDVAGASLPAWAMSDAVLPSVARLLRRLHEASEGFHPPADTAPESQRQPDAPSSAARPQPELPANEPRIFSHRDLTAQNTVFRDGQAWGLIDFDLCDWTTPSVDLANTAMHWVPLCDPIDRPSEYPNIDVGRRLRIMLDAYGRDRVDATQLLASAQLRFSGVYAAMRWAAQNLGGGWARMWDEGVGDVITRRVGWFASVRDDLAAALGS